MIQIHNVPLAYPNTQRQIHTAIIAVGMESRYIILGLFIASYMRSQFQRSHCEFLKKQCKMTAVFDPNNLIKHTHDSKSKKHDAVKCQQVGTIFLL